MKIRRRAASPAKWRAIINEECFDALDAPIARIASVDSPVPFSPPLEEAFLPKVEDVVREARRLRNY